MSKLLIYNNYYNLLGIVIYFSSFCTYYNAQNVQKVQKISPHALSYGASRLPLLFGDYVCCTPACRLAEFELTARKHLLPVCFPPLGLPGLFVNTGDLFACSWHSCRLRRNKDWLFDNAKKWFTLLSGVICSSAAIHFSAKDISPAACSETRCDIITMHLRNTDHVAQIQRNIVTYIIIPLLSLCSAELVIVVTIN